jgi:Mrp family chromosome partitioning ATPase
MSKIEKALGKARQDRGNLQLVPVPGAPAASAGTALVTQRAAHPETIANMMTRESKMLAIDDLSAFGIIHRERVEDPVVQVFRGLRTKVVQQSQGQSSVVLVTAVNKESGSSFIARNLGAAFAFDAGKTALLIDGNLKNPSVHQWIPNASGPGLMDYLDNPDLDLAGIIRPAGIPRYRAITAGAPHKIPGEYFSSLKMRRLMDTIRVRYSERYIIIDGPPMSDMADIRVLSEFSDYVLIVARYGRATSTQIAACLNAVSDRKLLGIVFNDEPSLPRLR